MDELAIFTRALDIESPAERAAFLQQACGPDSALRGRVEALLQSHQAAGSFLQGSPVANSPPTVDAIPTERLGTQIGPYKLVEQIGEGGMGTVWMAQQTEPVKRLVALKLIKSGMDSRQVNARFEAERQALALMDHPNIVRDFPLPEDPSSTRNSPPNKSRSMPRRAWTIVSPMRYVFVTARASKTGTATSVAVVTAKDSQAGSRDTLGYA